jgi:hypothetical protein
LRQLRERAGFKTGDRENYARLEPELQAVHLDGEVGQIIAKIARARTKMAADAAPRGKEGGYSVMLFYTRAYLKIA